MHRCTVFLPSPAMFNNPFLNSFRNNDISGPLQGCGEHGMVLLQIDFCASKCISMIGKLSP